MRRAFPLTLVIAAAFAATGPALAARDMVQIKGSDTLVNLVQVWAEMFTEDTGRFVAVTGGGSGTGIAALIDGKTAVANASRHIKGKEIELARGNGVEPVEFAVAIDGLCVIVNDKNPVQQLSVEEIGKLFRGDIPHWKGLGGPNTPVTLYGRQPNSGTYVFFQERVLGKKDYAATMNQMNGNAQIVEAVRNDSSALGYVGIAYVVDEEGKLLPGVRPLEVKTPDGVALSPLDREAVNAGRYPLSRPLLQYTDGTPQGAVAELLRFELSAEGQKIAEKLGFYPVGGTLMEKNFTSLGE